MDVSTWFAQLPAAQRFLLFYVPLAWVMGFVWLALGGTGNDRDGKRLPGLDLMLIAAAPLIPLASIGIYAHEALKRLCAAPFNPPPPPTATSA